MKLLLLFVKKKALGQVIITLEWFGYVALSYTSSKLRTTNTLLGGNRKVHISKKSSPTCLAFLPVDLLCFQRGCGENLTTPIPSLPRLCTTEKRTSFTTFDSRLVNSPCTTSWALVNCFRHCFYKPGTHSSQAATFSYPRNTKNNQHGHWRINSP